MRCIPVVLVALLALTAILWNTEGSMGKATIISEHGAGLYTIQPEWSTVYAVKRIAQLTHEIDLIDDRLSTIDGEITTAQIEYTYSAEVLTAAILNKKDEKEIEALQKTVLTNESTMTNLKKLKSFLQLRKLSHTKQIDFINQYTATPAQVQAWCADYTEALTGTVGTVEIGRRDTPPIIKPAGTFTQPVDGQLVPLMSQSPAATYWNLAMLPGAAKWMPRYRTGTASSVNRPANTMSVAIDPLTISGIACDEAVNLTDVPVQYMTCDASAFNDGDQVVVEYNYSWTSPTELQRNPIVVGFVQEPRQCDYRFKIVRDDGQIADPDHYSVYIYAFEPDWDNITATNPHNRVLRDDFSLQKNLGEPYPVNMDYDPVTQEFICRWPALSSGRGLWVVFFVFPSNQQVVYTQFETLQYPRRLSLSSAFHPTTAGMAADLRHVGDLIPPGQYLVTFPYIQRQGAGSVTTPDSTFITPTTEDYDATGLYEPPDPSWTDAEKAEHYDWYYHMWLEEEFYAHLKTGDFRGRYLLMKANFNIDGVYLKDVTHTSSVDINASVKWWVQPTVAGRTGLTAITDYSTTCTDPETSEVTTTNRIMHKMSPSNTSNMDNATITTSGTFVPATIYKGGETTTTQNFPLVEYPANLQRWQEGSPAVMGTPVGLTVSAEETTSGSFQHIAGANCTATDTTYSPATVGELGGAGHNTFINAYSQFFEVTTTITGSGSVWPPAKLLEDGESTTFKITPDPGHLVQSVTGAGGTYNATTMEYTTGALSAAATVEITFAPE